MTSWLDDELEKCRFADGRLGKRFRFLLERLAKGMGKTIPMPARIGPARRPLTVSFPTRGSASGRFFPAIFRRRGLASKLPEGGFWCCTTPPNSLFSEKILWRSG